jgi:hypothetical protein
MKKKLYLVSTSKLSRHLNTYNWCPINIVTRHHSAPLGPGAQESKCLEAHVPESLASGPSAQ